MVLKTLSSNHRMHNLYTKFIKILEICKQFSEKLANESGMFHTAALFIGFRTWKYWPYPFGRDRGH